jgi:GNAT superfamily N-acetyltransferase
MNRLIILLLLPFIMGANGNNCECGSLTKENIMDVVIIKVFKGAEAKKYIDDIADMRITMFKEYPYLYDGSIEYEREYLETYFKSENALVLLVFNKDKVVGFSNIIPLSEEMAELKKPFENNNLDVKDYLYIGEVMLKKPYRGKGLLRNFFEHHENYAKEKGYSNLTFITSKRPENHPMKPKDYRDLGPIWQHFGYNLDERLIAKMSWKQVDTGKEEENNLSFWVKKVSE